MPRTIEALAARHVADLMRVAPRGPYRIAGFCYGGVVALEMARQLAESGERVSLLALFNVTAYDLFALVSPGARRRFRGRWIARVRYLRGKPDAWRWIARRLSCVATDLVWRAMLPLGLATMSRDRPASDALLRASLREAFRRYVPRPHAGDVVLFLAEETLPLYADDAREAWAGIAIGAVEIRLLPRDGYAMLVEPDVARLAEWLEPHLR
jgi:thioesterase domain-containing protein